MMKENVMEKENNTRKVVKRLAAYATAVFMSLNMSSVLKTSDAKAEGIKDTKVVEEVDEMSIFDKYPSAKFNKRDLADSKKYKDGTFIDNFMTINDIQYDAYVVKSGDNTSRISEKICKHNGVEISTKYWPVIAYLNQYPCTIRPSDIVIFLDSVENMDELLAGLKSSNWYSKYVQYNKIRKNAKKNITIGQVLDEIYGAGTSKDSAFVRKYLKTIGMDPEKYNAGTELNNYTYFKLTDWIPTSEELIDNNNKEKTKTR